MVKTLAWLLFLSMSAAFIGQLAVQQCGDNADETRLRCAQPLPEMVRLQQTCDAADCDEK